MYLVATAANNYVSNPVTAGTWIQLNLLGPTGVALNPNQLIKDVNSLGVMDTSGQTIAIGIGASTASVVQIGQFEPNCDSAIPIMLNAGMSIYITSVGANATQGQLMLTFMKGKRG